MSVERELLGVRSDDDECVGLGGEGLDQRSSGER